MNQFFYIKGRKKILTDAGIIELKTKYSEGYSQIKIAKMFNVSEDTVRRWMKENNINIRKRKYNVNEQYFSDIDSPEKAYWLGFLSADGYVHQERGQLTIELQESDREHLEKFRKAIQCSAPIIEIYCGKNKEFLHYRFSVKCRKMIQDLEQYNIVQKKSLIFYPKNIPKELFKYWLIGYIDGDGCIFQARKRLKISITGTLKTLQIIKDYFQSNNVIRLEHRCKNTYCFTLEVDKSEKFLINETKYYQLDFPLERKKAIVASFIQ